MVETSTEPPGSSPPPGTPPVDAPSEAPAEDRGNEAIRDESETVLDDKEATTSNRMVPRDRLTDFMVICSSVEDSSLVLQNLSKIVQMSKKWHL